MSTLVIPNGFELVAFGWNGAVSLRHSSSWSTPVQPKIYGRICPAVEEAHHDRAALDEDAERWDGLS